MSTIMLIEDNADDEALALDALRRGGVAHPVVIARDGAQALELLLPSRADATAVKPALVLLDLRASAVSDVDVLRRIRSDARTATLPVVVLTAADGPASVVDCYDAGANSCVVKPESFDALVRAMQQIAHYWLRLNEPASK